MIPAADAASRTTQLLGKVADTNQSAGANPTHGPVDVWKNTSSGIVENAQKGDPGPALSGLGLVPGAQLAVAGFAAGRSAVGVGKALDDYVENFGDRGRSLSDVGTGMKQQLNALADQAKTLFHGGDKPPPEGVLGHFGAAVGMISTLEQLVCMPLSAIPTPALPAVRITDLDVGIPHAHAHPPNVVGPGPPIPLPSIGPVIPIPYVSGASTVLINGLPAARCGDIGLGVFCGGFFPLFEIFLGSSSVWLEGARAARVGTDITKHCIFSNPKSLVKTSDLPIGPSLGTLIGSSPNVMIGGFPLPSLTNMAMGAMFKGLFKGIGKLGRLIKKAFKGKGAQFSRIVNSAASDTARTGIIRKPPGPCKVNFIKEFPRANALVNELVGTGKIRILDEGDRVYRQAVMRDLRQIACSNTGREMLEQIQKTDATVYVHAPGVGDKADVCIPLSEGPSRVPGAGSDSTIVYHPGNPPRTSGSPGHSVLNHELGHARNNALGQNASKAPTPRGFESDRWTNMEEYNNINNHDNPYRDEWGLPQRTGHDDVPL
jgi:uncharacterized Zn-binding protein involved in type VI secretion